MHKQYTMQHNSGLMVPEITFKKF